MHRFNRSLSSRHMPFYVSTTSSRNRRTFARSLSLVHFEPPCTRSRLRFSAVFWRLPIKAVAGSVPSHALLISRRFGTTDQTGRFVKRYLKATHCDLFFADGAVLVEGPAGRTFVPHFVRKRDQYEYLRRCYITWLEIGGSHAHRLKSLLVHLGLNTLIITDLDAKDSKARRFPPCAEQTSRQETRPLRPGFRRTRRSTLCSTRSRRRSPWGSKRLLHTCRLPATGRDEV